MLLRGNRTSWRWSLLTIILGLGLQILVRAEPGPIPPAVRLWKFPLNTRSSLSRFLHANGTTSSSTPAVAPDGTIYLGSFNGTFFAVTSEGHAKWRFKSGLEIHSSPAIADDGTIYFGSRDRQFYALNPDGSLKWKFATDGWVDSSPAIATNGTIYFGSWDNHFYALNRDGSLKWRFDAGGIVDSSPAIAADGAIYFGSHDKNFYALNPDGTPRWKFSTGGGIISSPAIGADGKIYFSSLDGNLYALNPDGTQDWRYHSSTTTCSSPVLSGAGRIAIGIDDRTDIISPKGQLIGFRASPVPVQVCAAAVAGRFYVSAPWRTVVAVETGDPMFWKADLDANASSSVTIDGNGTLYVCAENALYAFRLPEKIQSLDSPWPMFRADARHTGRVGGTKSQH